MCQSVTTIPVPASTKPASNHFRYHTSTGVRIAGDAIFAKEIALAQSWFGKNAADSAADAGKSIHCKESAVRGATGAYEIDITTETIEIRAGDGAGMLNGLQTIRQLVLSGQTDRVVSIPCASIQDKPRFEWRGFMIDTSRHFFPAAFIKKMIDAAAMHHMNVFHWHLTDDQGWRFPVNGYPKMTEIGAWRTDPRTTWDVPPTGGFYTTEEIRDVVAYAAERHVEVVPEVDLPGHSCSILAAYPELGCTGGPYNVENRFGIFDDILCAGNDAIFDFCGAVFDTLAELFPSRFVHIGGDEVKKTRWETCPKCGARMKAEGIDDAHSLQSWVTVKLAKMLAARGKTPIGWDEVLEGSDARGLPEDLIVMSWRGQKGGLEASEKGHRVIMTPLTDGCYLNFKNNANEEEPGHLDVCTVEKSYAYDPVAPGMSEKQAALVMGGQCNLWTEVIYAGRIAEYMLFPRLCAVAEALWSPKETRSLESFEARLGDHRKRLDKLDITQYRGPLK
jgi:hexosaminidase